MTTDVCVSPGNVYILVSPATPNLVKIGRTTGLPELRAREVSRGTGVPAKFEVAWACEVTDCAQVERMLHDSLASYRYRPDREFFELPVAEAVQRCEGLAGPHRRPVDLKSEHASDQTDAEERRPTTRTRSKRAPQEQLTGEMPKGFVPASQVDPATFSGAASYTVRPWIHDYHHAVVAVCPEILFKLRRDGKVIYTPPDLAHRAKNKNLTTIHLGTGILRFRIIDDVEWMNCKLAEKYHPALLESYKVRLANLLIRLRQLIR